MRDSSRAAKRTHTQNGDGFLRGERQNRVSWIVFLVFVLYFMIVVYNNHPCHKITAVFCCVLHLSINLTVSVLSVPVSEGTDTEPLS